MLICCDGGLSACIFLSREREWAARVVERLLALVVIVIPRALSSVPLAL